MKRKEDMPPPHFREGDVVSVRDPKVPFGTTGKIINIAYRYEVELDQEIGLNDHNKTKKVYAGNSALILILRANEEDDPVEVQQLAEETVNSVVTEARLAEAFEEDDGTTRTRTN